MPGPALTRLALNSEYEDLHDLVYHVTGKFCRKYALPIDDLIGPAHAVYVKERERWHHGKKTAALSSWLYTKIWYGLMSFVRREMVHRTRYQYGSEERILEHDETGSIMEDDRRLPDALVVHSHNFRMDLEGELSPHAASVVSLVLDMSADFGMVYAWHTHKRKKIESHHMLNALREHLGDCGWPVATIEKTFQEIGAVVRRL